MAMTSSSINGDSMGNSIVVYTATNTTAIKVISVFNSGSVSRTLNIHIGTSAAADNQIASLTLDAKETIFFAQETFILSTGDNIYCWADSSGDIKVSVSVFPGLD